MFSKKSLFQKTTDASHIVETSHRARPFFSRDAMRWVASALILFLGFVLAAPLNFFTSWQVISPTFNVIDGSWMADIPYRLRFGEVSGRDFVFTYGPLYQLTHALGLWIAPGDAASLLRFRSIVEVVLTMTCVWLLLTAFPLRTRWRALLYLLWAGMSVLDTELLANFKPLGAACLISLCTYWLGGAGTMRQSPLRLGALITAWAVATPLLLLYSFDMGALAFFALLLSAAVVLTSTRSARTVKAKSVRKIAFKCVAATTIGFTAFALLTFSLSDWTRYLKDSAELARAYTLALAIGISPENLLPLIVAFVAMIVVVWWIGRRLRYACFLPAGENYASVMTPQLTTLLGFTCFSLLSLRSALTRSDTEHVVGALIPFLFLATVLALAFLHINKHRFAPFLTIGIVLIFAVLPINVERNGATSALRRLAALIQFDWRPARLEITHPEIQGGLSVLEKEVSPALFVWPSQTILNVITDKRSPNYMVQNYAATSPRLETETTRRMSSTSDLPVIFLRRRWAIDGVENLTRNPLIFRYLLENYQATSQNENAVLLKRRGLKQSYKWREQMLLSPNTSFRPATRSSITIAMPSDSRTQRASSLLVLRMNCSKTPMFLVGKTGQCLITFVLSNGERRTQKILVPPDGKLHEVLVSATSQDDPDFMRHFAPTPQQQRGEIIKSIVLTWAPLDPFSVTPEAISLDSISVLQTKSS